LRYYTGRMNTVTTLHVASDNSERTEHIAETIGQRLRGGEVIELVSDLGGGKTTFTRGLARGAGSKDVVGSPTFTISKVYEARTFEIHHFDFYRLSEAGIVADEIAEYLNDPSVVTVVEWGDIVHHVLPVERLTITITQTPAGIRELTFAAPETYQYLLEDVR